ncbi:hypothetical protein [endosymbiont 'TC1' of Trimyema compressum]|uniref:hypothetical protein n=1 Tax=endosymbiont 'TC1' of Trimyema compressum TaxID=243899 RepID=UPI001392495A|nr:hypothetical protein [endosymbiont 'TC1' of Trimyema compressum]
MGIELINEKDSLNSIMKAEDSDKIITLARQNGVQGFIEKIRDFSSQTEYKKPLKD